MNKKKYLIILALITINVLLIVHFAKIKTTEADNKNCYNTKKIFADKDVTISEGVRCNDVTGLSYGVGKTLFSFYGTDADCYSSDKTKEQKQECKKNHIWGGKGTMRIHGNWVIKDAEKIFFNGHDKTGNHWWMTSLTEPLGNVLGFVENYAEKTNSIIFGNNVVIGNNLIFNDKGNGASNALYFPNNEENQGIKIEQNIKKGLTVSNINNIANFKIRKQSNDNILYEAPNGININGTIKINATTTFRKEAQATKFPQATRPSNIEYKKQYVWDYHLLDTKAKTSMQTREQFIGYNPIDYNKYPPYKGKFYPQPYAHYHVTSYKAVTETPSTGDTTVKGDIYTNLCQGHKNETLSSAIQNDGDCNNNNIACTENGGNTDSSYQNLGNGGCAQKTPATLPEVFKCSLMCNSYNMDSLKEIP